MNLSISATPTGIINVRASENYSSEDGYEMYAEESVQPYAEETVDPEQVISENDTAYYNSDTVTEVQDTGAVSSEVNTTALETTAAAQTPGEEFFSSEPTAGTEPGSVEMSSSVQSAEATAGMTEINNTTEVDDAAESTNIGVEKSSTEVLSTEELSSEEIESVEETTEEETEEVSTEENEIALQAEEQVVTDNLSIKWFNGYKESGDQKTIEINSEKELILLSHCKPEELQDVTIKFKITGNPNITKNGDSVIKKDDDLSEILSKFSNEETTNITTEKSESTTESQTVEDVESDNENNNSDSEEEISSDINESIMVTKVVAGQDYTFQGLGSEAYPFRGKITGEIATLSIDQPFFKGLSSKASLAFDKPLTLNWFGDGTTSMFVGLYQFDSDGESIFPAVIINGSTSGTMGNLIGIVQNAPEEKTIIDSILTINEKVDIRYADSGSIDVCPATGDAGLVCNTLKNGTIKLEGFTFPTKAWSVTSANGNAGGIIGSMEASTNLKISSDTEIASVATVTSNEGNAGGIVGEMKNGAEIITEAAFTQKGAVVKATAAVGGAIGKATNQTFENVTCNLTLESPDVTGSEAGAKAGGFIGEYILDDQLQETELAFSSSVTVKEPKVIIYGANNTEGGEAGGYVGLLNLNKNIKYVIGSEDPENPTTISFTYKEDSAGKAGAYGAIVGHVTSITKASTLCIRNFNIISVASNKGKANYHGGLVGVLGSVNIESDASYMEVENISIHIVNPYSGDEAGRGFGGIVGRLATNSTLKVKNVSVDTTSKVNGKKIGEDDYIWEGGGIVGYAEKGSVLELSGTTDLSNTYYVGRYVTGQIVAYQDDALIYALGDGNGNGWKLVRSKGQGTDTNISSGIVNDIGNYGEVIRLKYGEASSGLGETVIKIDETTHDAILNNGTALNWGGATITLNSTDEFALLSIAWSSEGYFSADPTNVNKDNWESLFSKNINILSDVNLTGTGITGFGRDTTSSDSKTYSGTLNGQKENGESARITLSIGKNYGLRDGEQATGEGSGKVYTTIGTNHSYLGLFAKAEGTIENLIIDGEINVSTHGGRMNDIRADKGHTSAVAVGGIAAVLSGSAIVNNVTMEQTIKVDRVIKRSLLAGSITVGGMYGYLDTSAKNPTLVLDKNVQEKAVIELTAIEASSENVDSQVFAGGVMGRIVHDSVTVSFNSLTIGGSITTDASKYAYIGGLIGVVRATKTNNSIVNRRMNIKGVTFDKFTITASKATEVCGGLFGSIWSDVGVYFMGPDDSTPGDNTKLTVRECTINALNTSVGGLAYRSSGIWEIRHLGINIESNGLTINAGNDVGLLVCRGEYGHETLDGTYSEFGALYLRTTEYWGGESGSYKLNKDSVTVTGNNGVFDEFVAHTADLAGDITDNYENGVVSIATKDRQGVEENQGLCTTYQNRTTYGENKINGCSRHYYDLDKYEDEVENSDKNSNGYIDTPEELMLWSVRRYVYNNLKAYFAEGDCGTSGIIGTGADSSEPVVFDMQKYSYYPINLDGGVGVQNCTIIFYNEEIEGAEKAVSNKTTTGTVSEENTSNHTQHFTMHCGLFLHHRNTQYIKYDDSKKTTVSVYKVTFEGSIGKYNNNGSGVLFAGTTAGYVDTNGIVYIAEVNLNDVTFNKLKVVDCETDYAPLLMNYVSSYSTLNLTDIKTEDYEMGTGVASSLIGHVGASDCKQISMTFKDMVLPDKMISTEEGIFTHASFLESFQYATSGASVATYNFYKENDWNASGKYDHKVTYGQEITASTEYEGEQIWYYNADTHGWPEGEVYGENNSKDFSSYLPYVYMKYKETDYSHEIKVNQRVSDITHGCGTYGHPYEITLASEMKIISEYLSTGEARKDWRVTIVKNQTEYCTKDSETKKGSNDITLQYNGSSWYQVQKVTTDAGTDTDTWEEVPEGVTLEKQVMHRYMLNAYYDIQGTTSDSELEISDFSGFGTSSYPFRGVITSSTDIMLVLKGASSSLIPYSYGSVIKNLTVCYRGDGITLTKNTDTPSTSDYYPDICFGGVIGCVLGGDNIIDNVTVQMEENWKIKFGGNQKHLIEAGGYVGSVCGGGVIFRGMTENGKTKAGLNNDHLDGVSVAKDAYESLYVNAYVGRVMDGYAFNESSDTTSVLQNTDKNYQIATLQSNILLTVTNGAVNVSNEKQFLVLTAIVNSGAGSGGQSNAYNKNKEELNKNYLFGNGAYGKVRNASYGYIGKSYEDSKNDFARSQSDDRLEVNTSNLPYLIKNYCDSSATAVVYKITSNMSVNVTGNLDMSLYGNGYQGIGARYVSNAICYTEGTITKNYPTSVVPKLQTFNGNSKTIVINMQVREYADDDFHAASVGGVFNLLYASDADCTVKALTLSSTKSGTDVSKGISLTYYNPSGVETEEVSTNWKYTDENNESFSYENNVGVGGIAGSTTSISAETTNITSSVNFVNIELKNMAIKGPIGAGGLLGIAGREAPVGLDRKNVKPTSPVKNIAILIQPNDVVCSIGVNITDCSYDNITVTAKTAAGGFCGYIDAISDVSSSLSISKSNVPETSEETKKTETIIGQSSTIGTKNSTIYSGGIFGYVKTKVYINISTDDSVKYDTAVLDGVSVYATDYAGGFIGKIDEKEYQINQVAFRGSSTTNCVVWAVNENEKNAAGEVTLEDQSAITGRNHTLPEEGTAAGGILGMVSAGNGTENKILNAEVQYIQINSEDTYTYKDENNTTKQRMQRNGGIVGYIEKGDVTLENCDVNGLEIYGSRSGGITGAVGIEKNSYAEATIIVKDCTVSGTAEDKNGVITGSKIAGGIIGVTSVGKPVRIEGCEANLLTITSSDWGAGGLIGDIDYNTFKDVYFFDCAIKQSKIRGADVGGCSGTLRGSLTASNLLINQVSITSIKWNGNVGIVVGGTGERPDTTISVAGLCLQKITASDKSGSTTQLFATSNPGNVKSYFAFADYTGSSLTVGSNSDSNSGTDSGSDTDGDADTDSDSDVQKITLLDAEEVAPYVVTSPTSTLHVFEGNTDKYLYGDGAFWTSTNTGDSSDTEDGTDVGDSSGTEDSTDTGDSSDTEDSTGTGEGSDTENNIKFKVNAQEIYENRSAEKDGHYAYSKIENVSFDFTSLISTYNTNQSVKVNENFPVLQLTAGDTDSVSNYLDILTNGGFSEANNLNSATSVHVRADVTVYSYNKENQKFVKAVDENGVAIESALKMKTDTNNQISFYTTTDYDNGKDRFTLLTVTFEEANENGRKDGEIHEYKIQIPVIVRRMLEIDFSATLSYGTNFRKENYLGLNAHVLENFGSSITGYLTYTYNSANGEYTDYGWQSYIEAGGNVAEPLEKAITFNQGSVILPEGTQLSLIDESDGKAYYYTVTGNEKNNIPLSSFTASDGVTKYEEPSISELMNVQITSGTSFVKVDVNGKPEDSTTDSSGTTYPAPTVRIKTENGYEYYRLAGSGETGKYAINVADSTLKDDKEKSKIIQSYYLVITVPKNSSSVALNGSLETTIEKNLVPNEVHYLKINGDRDGHANTASTYLILSGYQHVLNEAASITDISKKLSAAESIMKVDVVDAITFPNDQIYQDTDELYQRFVGSLQKKEGDTSSAEQFPSGTTGTAQFYVYKEISGVRTYYKYEAGEWKEATEATVVTSYDWTSSGGNMELPLGVKTDNGITPIGLQGVRKLVKGDLEKDKSTFYVEVKMDITIPASGLDVIPQSKAENGNPEDFAKLVYYSQLSTVSQSLTYSSNRASCSNTRTAYYRDEPTGAKLTYEADEISQLGINLLDLQYLDTSREHSLIDTTAVYDLSSMKNLDTTLKESSGIKFTLVLMPKNINSDTEEYQDAATDADKYLSVALTSSNSQEVTYNSGTWSWTIPKTEYWEDDNVKTDSVFDGNVLTQTIQLKVNVTNVEAADIDHYYSNYKVVLTAEIIKNNTVIENTSQTDNIIYTLAKIKPEFVSTPTE